MTLPLEHDFAHFLFHSCLAVRKRQNGEKGNRMTILNGSEIDRFAQLIFSPDPASRFQYEKVHGKKESQADDQALRALMFAVLEDGIACFQGRFFKPSRTNEKLFQEAEEWINSNDDAVFSFINVCESLGLDPERFRKGLEQWKAKQIRVPIEERKRLILGKGKSGRKKIMAQGSTPVVYEKPTKGVTSPLRLYVERR